MGFKPLEIDNIPSGWEVDFCFTFGRVLNSHPPKGEEKGAEQVE
jgi:hypothetical protein